jgi:hypothetical protein
LVNIVCFPHYTCGGLLCDILNGTFSEIAPNGGVNSIGHSLGKIGDSTTVMINYDQEMFLNMFEKLKLQCTGDWIGTHCWPGRLDLSIAEQVIVVTTTTFRSKLYRWIRAYHHYYLKSDPWISVSGQQRIDKERETAKNYLIAFEPVFQPNVVNIEFAEVVENSVQFQNLTAHCDIGQHLDRWRKINSFLYNSNIWSSTAFQRFYEAESEVCLNKHYVYQ